MRFILSVIFLSVSTISLAQIRHDHCFGGGTDPCKTVSIKKSEKGIAPTYKNVTGTYCFNKKNNDLLVLTVEGKFENGKLMDGRVYLFDEYGLLESIEVYKEGEYCGNGVDCTLKMEKDSVHVDL
ncbi:MAG: hypothetical protein H6600_09250 [Flavobacteriales bacterium]|nr:hypothetical protein [Flavobacteriales bacterium]